MPHKHLKILTAIVAFAGIASLFSAGFFTLSNSHEFNQRNVLSFKNAVPVNFFEQKKEAYEAIGEPVLVLKYVPPQLRLPDLRNLLIYYGRNGRPDAKTETPKMHFSFSGLKTVTSVAADKKIFLVYDKKGSSKYNFSPNNEETNLWFISKPEGNTVQLSLFMKNENGEIIQEPSSLANFSVQEKEFIRFAGNGLWEIGKWRVDGTLLARQKARWFGPDCFLEKHGGEEFTDMLGKHRIDFEEGEAAYSVFVRAGDCLVWKDDRWQVCNLEGNGIMLPTSGLPIMSVKKIDERVMNFELWDVEGKAKVVLNLIKTQENLTAQNISQDFKFVGARTRTQCVFQVNQDRMIVKPNDWLLLTDGGWKKLTTAQEIDDYVNRKLTGTLFVFDEIKRKEEKSLLVGTVFNPARTEMQEVEIAMQTTGMSHLPPALKELSPQFDPKAQTAKMHKLLPNSFTPQNAKELNSSKNNPIAIH